MCSKEFNANKSMSILAIDDEETMVKLYSSILQDFGHKVTIAKTGKAAKEKIDTGKYDLVFLDLKLPDIEGIELMKDIRDKLKFTPVIIVTAHPSLESSIEAIRSGEVYEYIIKPFGAKELELVIRRAVEKAELLLENKRLMRKLETTNQALQERVDELEDFAKISVSYEKKITDLTKKINKLEDRVQEK